MEKMTDKELQQLRELQAKAKRVKRAEDEFLREADSRKNELLQRWGLSDSTQAANQHYNDRQPSEQN